MPGRHLAIQPCWSPQNTPGWRAPTETAGRGRSPMEDQSLADGLALAGLSGGGTRGESAFAVLSQLGDLRRNRQLRTVRAQKACRRASVAGGSQRNMASESSGKRRATRKYERRPARGRSVHGPAAATPRQTLQTLRKARDVSRSDASGRRSRPFGRLADCLPTCRSCPSPLSKVHPQPEWEGNG